MIFKLIIIFIILSSIIIFFTKKLAYLGQAFSELTPISGGLIGFTLLAIITSMPELAMSISAVTIIKDPNLCGGDIFGSNLFNLTIIAAIEIFLSHGKFINSLTDNVKKLILLQLLFVAIPILFIFIEIKFVLINLSIGSITIILFYCYFMKYFNFDENTEKDKTTKLTLTQTIIRFLIFSSIIILAAIKITQICDDISKITGIGNSFLGALLLATVSSLPEIVLTFSLASMNQYSMAIGNILGSNFFNIIIFAIADLFMKKNLFNQLSKIHIIPFIFISFITFSVWFSSGKDNKKGVYTSWFILSCYISSMFLLYKFSSGH